MIRVLLNALHAKSGGGITYLRNILRPLQKDKNIDLILLLHDDQCETYTDIADGVDVYYVNFKQGFYRCLLWEQFILPGVAWRLNIDVTYSPANFGPLFAPKPVILLSNALAVGCLDKRFAKKIYWRALGLMTKWSIKRAARVLAVSHYAKQEITRKIGIRNTSEIKVIPHGVWNGFTPDNSVRENFILAVSDIYFHKNYHGLVMALAKIRKVMPGVHLKIVGSFADMAYKTNLETIITSLGLRKAVEFLGQTDRNTLRNLYRRCAVFAFPSLAEAFGIPLLEAMACGAPVVSSNTSAMPEVAGKAALYVNPENIEDLAMRLLEVLSDVSLQTNLSGKSLAHAANYSLATTAQKTIAALKQASNSSLDLKCNS